MKTKVVITEDSNSEMLRIETETHSLFEGNYRDFNRCGHSFKELLESVGCDVEIIKKDYDEWYPDSSGEDYQDDSDSWSGGFADNH